MYKSHLASPQKQNNLQVSGYTENLVFQIELETGPKTSAQKIINTKLDSCHVNCKLHKKLNFSTYLYCQIQLPRKILLLYVIVRTS